MWLNKNYEAELNLKDLLFHILYQWRIILLVGLIAAGGFGFKEYWSFEKYHRNGKQSPAEAQYEKNLQELEEVNAGIDAYVKLIQDKMNYRDTSILMQMDPTNIWTAEKKYYLNISTESKDSADRILTFLSEAFAEDIENETLSNVFGTSERKDIDKVASVSVNRDLYTVSVIGCGASAEEAVKRKAFVDSCVAESAKRLSGTEGFLLEELSDSVGTKTVLTTRDAEGTRTEEDLATIQKNVSADIQAYEKQRDSYIKTRDSLRVSGKPTAKVARQAFFGFALGAAVVVLACMLVYFFNGKLKTGREMRKRYDLALLGEVSHSRAWRKGKGIDRILERLEFGKIILLENELDNIASLIVPERNGKEIVLTGSLEGKRLQQVYEGLVSKLNEKGITVTLQADYLRNGAAVAATAGADSVLIIEEKYKSRIRDLNRMAEMLTIENAKVIGAVLL